MPVTATDVVLNTSTSLATKLSIEQTPMATTLAATGSMRSVPQRTVMIARLPKSDTVPFNRWNRASRRATAAADGLGRSRQVQC